MSDDVSQVQPAPLSDEQAVEILGRVSEMLARITPEQAQALLHKTDAEMEDISREIDELQRGLREFRARTRAAVAPLNERLGRLARTRLELAKRAPRLAIGA